MLSYVHGASTKPLLGETVGAAFDRTVARWPDRPALVVRSQGVRWSWRELRERVDALAAGIAGLGAYAMNAAQDRLAVSGRELAE